MYCNLECSPKATVAGAVWVRATRWEAAVAQGAAFLNVLLYDDIVVDTYGQIKFEKLFARNAPFLRTLAHLEVEGGWRVRTVAYAITKLQDMHFTFNYASTEKTIAHLFGLYRISLYADCKAEKRPW